jgi:ATP-dependent Lhr-like helicase
VSFGRLSPALQSQIVSGLGWAQLRPVQEQTIAGVLDGDNCVVLAPTAGGKTEAALFPVLSAMHEGRWAPTSALYVAPIRALLNNQEARLQELASLLGRRAAKWHGDVTDAARRRFVREPADLLATTPESLEALLMSTRLPGRQLLSQVQVVIIDEVHAFAADDRGAHLMALLERIAHLAGRDIQRIGLSATVGDPAEIADWLSGSSARRRRVIDPGGARKTAEVVLDHVGSLEGAASIIERLHPGRRRLVFVDSRRRVEALGSLLSAKGIHTFLSHSSLSLSQRAAAERAFAEERDCVIVATSSLELGLDVGDLDHVYQIDAPSTVSSFLQRMGRTGRRADTRPNCTFLTTSDEGLLQAAGLLHCWRQGFVEPAAPSRRAAHVLAHQLLALAAGAQRTAVSFSERRASDATVGGTS